jgi:hypothetical protein
LQEVFLSKQSQSSKGNNVLNALHANTDGFFSRGTCVSSTQLDRPFGKTWALLHLESYDLHEVFIETHTSDREEWDR